MVVRLKKTHQHNVIETVAALRRLADEFAARHRLGRPAVVGPPVLLADGFAAIEVDGRRLAVVGMILIGVVTLSAVQSLWWAIVPMLAGLGDLAGHRGDPGDASISSCRSRAVRWSRRSSS